MAADFSQIEFYFEDPRLKMTLAGRFLVRVLSLIVYFVLIISAIVFLTSEILRIRFLGLLLGLFLIHRFLHLEEADRNIFEMPKGKRINLQNFLTSKAYHSIERAFDRSLIKKTDFHLELLNEILNSKNVFRGLMRLGVEPENFKAKAIEFLKSNPENKSAKERLEQIEELIKAAFKMAIQSGSRFIGVPELFSALATLKEESLTRIFSLYSVDPGDLERALIFDTASRKIFGWQSLPVSLGGFVLGGRGVHHRIMNRAWTSRPTPELDRYSTDFTDLARREKAGFLIGHGEEYERLVNTLSRPTNPNALLIGDPSIGKEALIGHLAFQVVNDEVPAALFDKRLVGLRIADLVAGAKPEELQSRMQRIVSEIALAGNIILYIPEIHNLLKTSGEAYLSAADALMPIIQNNAFPVIGATYSREFKEYIEPRSDFLDLFEVIRIEEISEADAEKILVYESLLLESKTKIIISFGAIKESVKLAKKYFNQKFLPASADDLLKDSLSAAEQLKERTLTVERVIKTAETKVNIPIHQFSGEESQKLLNLESIIHERLIDQEEAVKAVAEALREYRSGLATTKGPIAAFLFVGPTGVGKTELSKILAKVQFGSESQMIRFDMSEYQDKQSFYRLIGSPDGQISGALTEAVRNMPYSLILLDEFEKAYPDILNLFLQVFDDGRLTDNWGRTVDFQNTIIIATSNAHSEFIKTSLDEGKKISEISDDLKKKLIDYFKPELLNRFSKIIVFGTLSLENTIAIAELNLNDLAENLKNQGIDLEFDESAIKKVAELGYNPSFGARPLRQVINENLKAPLSEKILKEELVKGSKTKVIFEDGSFRFIQ